MEGVGKDDIPGRLKIYEQLRRERASRIQAIARDAGRFYRTEFSNAAAMNRHLAKWVSDGRWIFEYDAERVAKEHLAQVGSISNGSERHVP